MSEKPNLGSSQDMDRSIGHALAWWNHVEDGLGDIFCALFGGVNHTPARNAYLAVVNFNTRLMMTNAAMISSNLPKPILDRWKPLKKQTEAKSGIRNRLTHFSRVSAKDSHGDEIIWVLPNFWDVEDHIKAMSGKGIRYNWMQIWEFGQAFGGLAIELDQLAREIELHVRAHPAIYPRSTLDPIPENGTPIEK